MPEYGNEHEDDGDDTLRYPLFDSHVGHEHHLAHVEAGHAEREQQIHRLQQDNAAYETQVSSEVKWSQPHSSSARDSTTEGSSIDAWTT